MIPSREPERIRDGRRLVLVVEDDPDTRRSVKEFLESKLPVRVLLAPDAEVAVQILSTTTPDLLIADHRLPGMSGVELLRSVRSTHPGLPCILMTGHPVEAAGMVSLETDRLTHVVMKPVTTGPFVAKLHMVLGF